MKLTDRSIGVFWGEFLRGEVLFPRAPVESSRKTRVKSITNTTILYHEATNEVNDRIVAITDLNECSFVPVTYRLSTIKIQA